MQTITTAFSRAANGRAETSAPLSVFWLMVWAIAILDDSERRENERRRKRDRDTRPTVPVTPKRKPSSGPRP